MSDDDVEPEAAQSSLCPCPNRFIKKPLNMTTIEKQGWQGRAGSLTSAPRPATPVETSAPRPATPSDPGLVRDSPGILHVTPQGDAHHKVCYRSSLHITPAI